jgi:hypothetical protein
VGNSFCGRREKEAGEEDRVARVAALRRLRIESRIVQEKEVVCLLLSYLLTMYESLLHSRNAIKAL